MKIYIDKECNASKYIDLYKDVTPEALRDAADKLEECNVKSFKFKNTSSYYNSKRCTEKRLETDAEMNARIKKESGKKIRKFKILEKKRKEVIEQAKKLGLVLTSESCINER